MVRMGARSIALHYAATVPANPEQLAETAAMLIALPTGGVWVADEGGILTAMIGVLLSTHHLSGALVANEAFWWSDTPGAGVRLLRVAVAWATTQGARSMTMIQPSGIAQLEALYTRYGFRPLETAWQLDLVSA